jgi:hypothetical protein
MPSYKAKFPPSSVVRIATRNQLEVFRRFWKYHHKLVDEQLAYGGSVMHVERVFYYHGGDPLYLLQEAPGFLWHEACLQKT